MTHFLQAVCLLLLEHSVIHPLGRLQSRPANRGKVGTTAGTSEAALGAALCRSSDANPTHPFAEGPHAHGAARMKRQTFWAVSSNGPNRDAVDRPRDPTP